VDSSPQHPKTLLPFRPLAAKSEPCSHSGHIYDLEELVDSQPIAYQQEARIISHVTCRPFGVPYAHTSRHPAPSLHLARRIALVNPYRKGDLKYIENASLEGEASAQLRY
jgi:hypothetical protein